MPLGPSNPDPTPRQLEVLRVIHEAIGSGTPPSFKDIARLIGVRSSNTIACYVETLERKGCLTRKPGLLFRALQVTERGRRLLNADRRRSHRAGGRS